MWIQKNDSRGEKDGTIEWYASIARTRFTDVLNSSRLISKRAALQQFGATNTISSLPKQAHMSPKIGITARYTSCTQVFIIYAHGRTRKQGEIDGGTIVSTSRSKKSTGSWRYVTLFSRYRSFPTGSPFCSFCWLTPIAAHNSSSTSATFGNASLLVTDESEKLKRSWS